MIEIKGKGGISVKVIADSISSVNGKRITTFELEYHRFIHAEMLTHRLFSRNSASSRAIPVQRMIDIVKVKPATPIHWGKNQAGMQAKEECNNPIFLMGKEDGPVHYKKEAWKRAGESAINWAMAFNEAGYHKQIVNRLLEPFQMMKVVVTATEWDNFFNLRCHEDSQPEIKELADCMYEALQQSKPELLYPGEWHTPYVKHARRFDGKILYILENEDMNPDGEISDLLLSEKEAIKISCSCCAQASYRKLDNSLEKAIALYDRLVTSQPVHASALEPCATPMDYPVHITGENALDCMQEGYTHVDVDGSFWSGNFQGWVQYRQLIPNHVCNNYNKEEQQ